MALGASGCAAHAAAAEEAPGARARELRVERQGDDIVVFAQAIVQAGRGAAWSALSDYDHLSDFIPGMLSSRTLSRSGSEAVVEQQGTAGFGPIRQKFTVRLAVTEDLHESITAAGVGGDLKRFASRYELIPVDAHRTRIVYRASIEPSTPVPPLVGVPVMRSMIRDQFDALLAEVERRAG
jgi:carbon monoxide dehydrogenase subunit G